MAKLPFLIVIVILIDQAEANLAESEKGWPDALERRVGRGDRRRSDGRSGGFLRRE